MPRLNLPSLPRPHFSRRSSGIVVVGLLVLSLGTAATAVTAELSDGVASGHPHGTVPQLGQSPAPVVAASPKPVKLSTKPKRLINSTILVTQRSVLTHGQMRQVRRIKGVRRTQPLTAGHASIDGNRAYVLGVNPQTFRPWTPKPTADSNALWNSVSGGSLTASFDMGQNAKLPLGKDVPVSGHRGVTPIRIGAFASVGMVGVDAVVSNARAREIGLTPRSAVLVSAPKADPLVLRKALLHMFGKHANAVLLKQVIITRDAGSFLTRAQISGFMNAAATRVGAPYVWGATGPNSFDCSGLVQWSFAQIGIRMPRVSEEQFLTGPHVAYKDARPGDLLFWHNDPTEPTNVDHVAIYIGNGKMLEAPHTGDVVKIAPVYLNNMAGVVRVDPALASKLS